jgi:hypothetical protein
MAKKRNWLGILTGFFVIMVFFGCYTPPKARPPLSQTVITVQRYPAKKAADARSDMEIYIDNNFSQYTVDDNQSVSIPVNDGVHYIYVKVGKNQSETLNFTAAQKTVPFMASVESSGALFWKKTTVTLSRSSVVDDTGSMTDKPLQERYNQE